MEGIDRIGAPHGVPQMCGSLFVTQIDRKITERDLGIFLIYGSARIRVSRDASGISLGCAWVDFENPDAAIRAAEEMDKSYLYGRVFRVWPGEYAPMVRRWPVEQIPEAISMGYKGHIPPFAGKGFFETCTEAQKNGRKPNGNEDNRIRSYLVWFDDGTVIVQAENTMFRVYQGLLSETSVVFADMFKERPDSHYKTSPVYIVPDRPDLMGPFLKVLHSPLSYSHETPTPWKTVIALVILGAKYQIQRAMVSALDQLCQSFPIDFPSYDHADKTARLVTVNNVSLFVNGLRASGLVAWLPTALYDCCVLGRASVLSSALDSGDKSACFRAIDAFQARTEQLYARWSAPGKEYTACTKQLPCIPRTLANWETALSRDMRQRVDAPLMLAPSPAALRDVHGMCASCAERWERVWEGHRRAIWDALPELFGLVSWEELHRAPMTQ